MSEQQLRSALAQAEHSDAAEDLYPLRNEIIGRLAKLGFIEEALATARSVNDANYAPAAFRAVVRSMPESDRETSVSYTHLW